MSGRGRVRGIWGAVALLLVACGGEGKKRMGSCDGDDECGAGTCFEGACYDLCAGQEQCTASEFCVLREREGQEVRICITAAMHAGCGSDVECADLVAGVCEAATCLIGGNLCGVQDVPAGKVCATDAGAGVCDGMGICVVPVAPGCGDGTCQAGEDCGACAADCACEADSTCQAGACVPPDPCGDGACDAAGGEDCATCPDDCACTGCGEACDGGVCRFVACDGRECGADTAMCDQSCGSCGVGLTCDWAAGLCVEDPCDAVNHEVGCCDGGSLKQCVDGQVQTTDCAGAPCGWDGGVFLYQCGVEGADPTGTFPWACPGTCAPDCSGMVCGDDGCNGSCGICDVGQECQAGACVPAGCVADCTGKECGDDGCGGSCGTCPAGQACQAGACVTDPCAEIVFADAALEAAVRAAIAKPSGTIGSADVAGLTQLVAQSAGIADLSGMECLADLVIVRLDWNAITDLAPLAGLPLVDVSLASNQITDPTPLAGIASLTMLTLGSNPNLKSLAPLAGMTQLKNLMCDDCGLTSVAALTNLTAMTTLDLRGNSITDLTPLAGMTGMAFLYLSGNSLGTEGLGPLSAMSDLFYLAASNTGISNLYPLMAAQGLTQLYATDNPIVDLAPLASLTALDSLDLRRTDVVDLGPVASLTELKVLQISNTPLTGLAPISGLTKLEWLTLEQCSLSDISALAPLTALTFLRIGFNGITDLAPLQGMTQMEALYATFNSVTSVQPLVDNPGIGAGDTLNLTNNPLDCVAEAANLADLQARVDTLLTDCP